MAMQAGKFFSHLYQIKAYVMKHENASEELKAAYDKLNQAFKKAFTPDEFKKALAGNVDVGSDLEERTTSTLLLMNQDRARRVAEESEQ